jgi:hypothetical protein
LGIAALSLPLPQPPDLIRDILIGGIGRILAAASLWFGLVRWPLRANLLGPLLLTGIRRRPWFWGIGSLFSGVMGSVATILAWRLTGSLDSSYAVWAISFTIFPLYMLLSRRVEIRQKGLAWSGMLWPWSKISAYAWDANHAEFAVLHLRNSGLRWAGSLL